MGVLTVRWPNNVAHGGSGGRGQHLEFHAGDHISKTTIAVFRQYLLADTTKPRSKDHGAHIQAQRFSLFVKVDRLGLTGGDAYPAHFVALEQTLFRVYVESGWNRLYVIPADRLAQSQVLFVGVPNDNRTIV